MGDDLEFYVEKCYRYYSQTYHTPLHLAKSILSAEEVVLIFMQNEMEDWTAEDMAEWKKKVDETPKVMIAAPEFIQPEEIDEEMWIAEQNALLKLQDEKDKKKQAEVIAKTHEAIDKLTESIKNIPEKK
jgi:Ser-tRNA(Ala) deacylase AlaX